MLSVPQDLVCGHAHGKRARGGVGYHSDRRTGFHRDPTTRRDTATGSTQRVLAPVPWDIGRSEARLTGTCYSSGTFCACAGALARPGFYELPWGRVRSRLIAALISARSVFTGRHQRPTCRRCRSRLQIFGTLLTHGRNDDAARTVCHSYQTRTQSTSISAG